MNFLKDNVFHWKNGTVKVFTSMSEEQTGDHKLYLVSVGMGNTRLMLARTLDKNLASSIYQLIDNRMTYDKASTMMNLFQRIDKLTDARLILVELFTYKEVHHKNKVRDFLTDNGFYWEEDKNFHDNKIKLGWSTIYCCLEEGGKPVGRFIGKNNGKRNFLFNQSNGLW